MMELEYDVVVVGGGHAGTEAAAAAARLGSRTLLITPDLSRIGQMSCNPAIGGVAKGVVAREVDALGGVMAEATDASRIQFRMLNRSKGPAVWGPRAQCDRARYPIEVRKILDRFGDLDLLQDLVLGLVVENERATGVTTRGGVLVRATSIVVTAGTFLRGKIHVGGSSGIDAGRAGEAPAIEFAESLEARGLEVGRFKTGTPPRIDGRSVNYEVMERQDGEDGDQRFSFYARPDLLPQLPCWITWTGSDLQRIVESNLERSALYGGEISGQGPRYCPSIEDKVVRFPDAPRHQVFLEPEGLDTTELYVNGLSTSLPVDVQLDFLRSVPGLEAAKITKPGYAIEYDYFPPHQLRHTLEVRAIPGLWFAGQINGTTGYEEAAGQGIVAGVNAALRAQGRDAFILERDQSYIGVMIDDLVTKGVDEPYRLFTSRAEFRLLLRQDNAARRLGPLAREMGLLTLKQEKALESRLEGEDGLRRWFADTNVRPERANAELQARASSPLTEPVRAGELLRRPELEASFLMTLADEPPEVDSEIVAAVEVEVKYQGYVARERERAATLRAQAEFRLDEDLPYADFVTISAEGREKLGRVRPSNVAQASRIPGISPSDLQSLIMEVRRQRRAPSPDRPNEAI